MKSFLFVLGFLACPLMAGAQELEPGAYWPIPRTLNIFTVANSLNWGDVAFDPSLPVEEARATINTTALAFTRAFGWFGRSANAGLMLPISGGHVQGLYLGEPTRVSRFGLADPRLKLAINLYGAPAMTPREFASYRQGLIVGVSVTVAPPLGQYDETKAINLGGNRWAFKPELGVSKTVVGARRGSSVPCHWGRVLRELLIGDKGGRKQLLSDYERMHQAPLVSHAEVVAFVRDRRLHGRGIGWIDAHLLASALVGRLKLWTIDPSLESLAQELGVSLT